MSPQDPIPLPHEFWIVFLAPSLVARTRVRRSSGLIRSGIKNVWVHFDCFLVKEFRSSHTQGYVCCVLRGTEALSWIMILWKVFPLFLFLGKLFFFSILFLFRVGFTPFLNSFDLHTWSRLQINWYLCLRGGSFD